MNKEGKMRKNKIIVLSVALLAIIIIALPLAACGGKVALPTEPQTFAFNAYEPNENVYEFKWMQWYAEQITQRTNGLMEFDVRPGGGYGFELDQYLQITGQGLVPISNTMDGYASGSLPEFIMGSQPMLFDNYEQFEQFRVQMEPDLAKVLEEKYNVVLLASAPNCDQSLMMKEPINSIEDLKGKKIRVLTEAEAQFMKAVGAVPVTVMFPELWSSFERGVIDGMTFYHMGLVDMKFYEVIKHVPMRTLRLNWSLIIANKDTFESWPKEWQNAFTGLKSEYEAYALADLDKLYWDARKIAEDNGVDFTPLPQSEMDKMLEIARPIWAAYADEHGDMAQKALKVARDVTGR